MNPKIPKPGEPIAGPGGQITRAWRNYLTSLAVGGDVSALWEAIERIRTEIGGGEGIPADSRVYGEFSVETFGLLADGLVRITLTNDEAEPAPSSYYGTGVAGDLGYHALPSGGFLPMTTGEIINGQPVLLYGPDGRLIYGPVT